MRTTDAGQVTVAVQSCVKNVPQRLRWTGCWPKLKSKKSAFTSVCQCGPNGFEEQGCSGALFVAEFQDFLWLEEPAGSLKSIKSIKSIKKH